MGSSLSVGMERKANVDDVAAAAKLLSRSKKLDGDQSRRRAEESSLVNRRFDPSRMSLRRRILFIRQRTEVSSLQLVLHLCVGLSISLCVALC